VSRAEYIRRAIVRMNDDMTAHARAQRLARASRNVRRESMRINAEFDAVERDIE
jgi:Arc/MetJ-type ribon-helix-helix transcriptional regulator